MCAEMNYLPDHADDLTVGEILRYYRGMQTRQARSWEQTRELMFIVYKAAGGKQAKTIYELLPLPTDPTQEEIKQAQEEKAAELREAHLQIMEYWKSKGLA